MDMDVITLLLLAGCGLVAGFIDAIAGGGGLLTLPALLAAGLSPTQALATNKLQSSFGSFSATWYFARHGYIDFSSIKWSVLLTFVGSMCGTLLVQQIDASALARLLPFLLMAFALYFLFSPRVGNQDSHRRLGHIAFALTVGLGVGFYDGFFGPGTGSFFAVGFVALAGFNLAKATAHSKLLNFTSNISALIFFALGGNMVWTLGLTMAIGQFIGARLGSRLVVKRGVGLIRPLLVIMSLAMSFKLLNQHYAWIG
ncbi:TSUP family transporter [Pseudaeromonas sharmana]|uniref:Probable membrane transporter protein n=1 Tax=Pseudaeromonas sharmana TaxID=328412 RepID=A0ABV8CPB6_9GAMM